MLARMRSELQASIQAASMGADLGFKDLLSESHAEGSHRWG